MTIRASQLKKTQFLIVSRKNLHLLNLYIICCSQKYVDEINWYLSFVDNIQKESVDHIMIIVQLVPRKIHGELFSWKLPMHILFIERSNFGCYPFLIFLMLESFVKLLKHSVSQVTNRLRALKYQMTHSFFSKVFACQVWNVKNVT